MAYFQLSVQIRLLRKRLTVSANSYERNFIIPQRCRDPKDDYLLELARVSDADILVSGDEDLTEMNRFGHCHIITLSQLKKALKK